MVVENSDVRTFGQKQKITQKLGGNATILKLTKSNLFTGPSLISTLTQLCILNEELIPSSS